MKEQNKQTLLGIGFGVVLLVAALGIMAVFNYPVSRDSILINMGVVTISGACIGRFGPFGE